MYSFLSYCFFTGFLFMLTKYIFPGFFYEVLLYANFYYRKTKKYIKDMNETELEVLSRQDVIDLNLTITEYRYKNELFIKLDDINTKSKIDIIVDEVKFNSVRKRVICPNSKDSFIMASLKTGSDDINIIEDIQKLSGLYFNSIEPEKVTKYFRYKYKNRGKLLEWSYMRADGDEFIQSF